MDKSPMVILLYKDKSFKTMNADNISHVNLRNPKLDIILIPDLSVPNAYIPVKPSIYFNFYRCVVYIVYQGFGMNYMEYQYEYGDYDMEDYDTDFCPKEFTRECNDVIELVNALHNLWKFRGSSMYISEFIDPDSNFPYDSWVVYPRYYNIKFYNQNGKIINELDSGELVSIFEKFKDKTYTETELQYCQEEYFEPLRDIFYTPMCKDYIPSDSGSYGLLPIMILLDEDSRWGAIKKPSQSLNTFDCVLFKVDDYGCYYLMQYGVYEEFLKANFSMNLYGAMVDKSVDDDFLVEIDKDKIPNEMNKRRMLQEFVEGHIAAIELLSAINSPARVIEFLLFIRHIASCVHYFLYDIFGEWDQKAIRENPDKGTRIRVLILLNSCKQNSKVPYLILTEPELTNQTIEDAILYFIKEDT